MRSLMVIIDGLGDDPISQFSGKTPFEYAIHPNIDKLLKCGTYSELSICGNDFAAESLGCILRLLGVEQKDFPLNRAYLELLANGRDITEYEMVLRCNLASVDAEGRLVSFNAMGLTPQEMAEAAAICNELWQGIEFMHLSEYRNLLILDNDAQILHNCRIAPPHESMGQQYDELLGDLKAKSLLLKTFIEATTEKLKPFAKNGVSYRIYPWGPSERKVLPSFKSLHGISGAAVCKAEIVCGIACALQMPAPVIPGTTADVDTNIAAKARAAQKLLGEYDFVLAHFNGSDEAINAAQMLASHTGAIVAVTGEADFITDGHRTVTVNGGHIMATRVVGTGCSLGALVAAFITLDNNTLDACAAAHALFKRSEEFAVAHAQGPGSFHSAFLDALYQISHRKQNDQ